MSAVFPLPPLASEGAPTSRAVQPVQFPFAESNPRPQAPSAQVVLHLTTAAVLVERAAFNQRTEATLLLLQAGYAYVPYSSLESVVEQSKEAYYLALRQTQGTRV